MLHAAKGKKKKKRHKIGRCQAYFFSPKKCKVHYTRQKVRINCNKKGSVYRDEFVCPLLAEAEAANCDGSCVFWEAKAARALLGKANWGDRSESSPGRRAGRETHTMLLLLASSLRAESLLFLPSLQLLEARGSTRGSVVIRCTRVGDENPTSLCLCLLLP